MYEVNGFFMSYQYILYVCYTNLLTDLYWSGEVRVTDTLVALVATVTEQIIVRWKNDPLVIKHTGN
jgi:hypothetical protein